MCLRASKKENSFRGRYQRYAVGRGVSKEVDGHADCRDPLVVRLDGPIDARNAGYLAVFDAPDRCVLGHPELLEGEWVWRFAPAKAWSTGPYRLVVRGTLEDPAGNRLNSRFEREVDQSSEPASDITIPLEVTGRP